MNFNQQNIATAKTFNNKVKELDFGQASLLIKGHHISRLTRVINFNDLSDILFSMEGEFIGGMAVVIAQICKNDKTKYYIK